jgi:membrane protein DedA with SNARE-associated domain
MAGFAHPRGFAPLWVYFFGWFALAAAQVWLFPPDEHSVLFNVTFFAVGAVLVAAVLTVAERRTRTRRR